MLVIFKSKAGADIMMFEENAKQILDLFGKETETTETGTAGEFLCSLLSVFATAQGRKQKEKGYLLGCMIPACRRCTVRCP